MLEEGRVGRVTSAPTNRVPRSAVSPKPLSRKSSMKSTANSSAVGAVTEANFTAAFDDVEQIQIFSGREVDQEMNKIRTNLENPNLDWERRVESIRMLRSLLVAGAAQYDEFFTQLRSLEPAFQCSVKDLRSQVVREACITIAFISTQLRAKAERFCELQLTNLLALLGSSVKIMSSCGVVCIQIILQHTHGYRLIGPIAQGMRSKAKEIRRYCTECFATILQLWPRHILEKQLSTLHDCIQRGLSDADLEARANSRKAFKWFREHFPDQADVMLSGMDAKLARQLQNETGAGPTNSLSSTSSRMRTLGSTESLRLTRQNSGASSIPVFGSTSRRGGSATAAGPRSTSAIDYGAVQRARAKRTVIPSSPAFGSSVPRSVGIRPTPLHQQQQQHDRSEPVSPERTYRTTPRMSRPISQSQPGSRSTSPASRYYSAFGGEHENSRVRRPSGIPMATCRSRDPSPTRSISSQVSAGSLPRRDSLGGRSYTGARVPQSPGMYTRRPPLMAEEILRNSRDQEDALRKALDTSTHSMPTYSHNRSLSLSRDSHCSDESETSSICSDRSLSGGGMEDMNEILTNLRSIHWVDRKEGLQGLRRLLASGHILDVADLRKITTCFNRMFMDPHTKVFTLFLETLNELIDTHTTELDRIDWLKVLLTKLFMKLGTDVLGSIQSRIQRTLDRIRDSFPHGDQFRVLTRFITDPTQTPTPKVKTAVLRYMETLARCMDPDELPQDDANLREAIIRLVTWTADTKSAELQRASQAAIIALYQLKTAYIATIVNQMPPDCQSKAIEVLGSHQGATSFSRDTAPPLATSYHNKTSSPTVIDGFAKTHYHKQPSDFDSPTSPLKLVESKSPAITSYASPPLPLKPPPSMSNVDERQRLGELAATLSNPSTRSELRIQSMDEMIYLMRDGSAALWEDNFRNILRILMDNIDNEDNTVRASALRALGELIRHQPHHLSSFAELTIIRILQAYKEKSKEVVREADMCAVAVVKALSLVQCVRILGSLMKGSDEEAVVLAAIKTMSRVIEMHSAESIADSLDDIMRALLQCYDHTESPVRKAAVFCMVTLHNVVGAEAMKPYLETLPGCKLKLLNLYIRRAQQTNVGSGDANSGGSSPGSSIVCPNPT